MVIQKLLLQVVQIDEKTWCLYVHTNLINNKKYIGITSQVPEKRWLGGYGYDRRLRFGRAIKKYGWNSFKHEILYCGLNEEEANRLERELIKEWKTQDPAYGYNMTDGGGGVSGFVITEETRRKMSEAKRGANHPNFGKHLSPETKRKIGEVHKGNKYSLGLVRSPETRQKMSEGKMKPVAAYLDDGTLVKTYRSALDAGEELGINRKNISLCCKGARKHAGGYCWRFCIT